MLINSIKNMQSADTATSSQGGPATPNLGTKSLLDAGPRSSGVSSDTAYAAQPGRQSNPSRFYQGTEGSWMSLQSLQSSLADEPMHASSSGKSAQQASLDIPTAAAGPQKCGGASKMMHVEVCSSNQRPFCRNAKQMLFRLLSICCAHCQIAASLVAVSAQYMPHHYRNWM